MTGAGAGLVGCALAFRISDADLRTAWTISAIHLKTSRISHNCLVQVWYVFLSLIQRIDRICTRQFCLQNSASKQAYRICTRQLCIFLFYISAKESIPHVYQAIMERTYRKCSVVRGSFLDVDFKLHGSFSDDDRKTSIMSHTSLVHAWYVLKLRKYEKTDMFHNCLVQMWYVFRYRQLKTYYICTRHVC